MTLCKKDEKILKMRKQRMLETFIFNTITKGCLISKINFDKKTEFFSYV